MSTSWFMASRWMLTLTLPRPGWAVLAWVTAPLGIVWVAIITRSGRVAGGRSEPLLGPV
ncbi:hypothetical protein [Isosphaera pallida]|uniref:hypothetical protein n=1 Tax=Isosphaera pallida TaxID=128 RepID=UPI00143C3568|nr:hypothetical protein [Isosphaera pallida]